MANQIEIYKINFADGKRIVLTCTEKDPFAQCQRICAEYEVQGRHITSVYIQHVMATPNRTPKSHWVRCVLRTKAYNQYLQQAITDQLFGREKKQQLEITQMLTLSISHISRQTAWQLFCESQDHMMGLRVYCKAQDTTADFQQDGLFVYIPDTIQDEVPIDLKCVMHFAKENHCGILCFDHKGPVVEQLKAYDWDTEETP